MNSVFGGYTGAGIMYGGVDSDASSYDGNPQGGYASSAEEHNVISNSSDSESLYGHGGGNGKRSEGEASAIYGGYASSGGSDSESMYSGGSAMSLSTTVIAGGAASNPREYNQSWFIEKHKIKNKTKSKDYSRLEELVDIIYEALNEKL
jgi:hypothetical protein